MTTSKMISSHGRSRRFLVGLGKYRWENGRDNGLENWYGRIPAWHGQTHCGMVINHQSVINFQVHWYIPIVFGLKNHGMDIHDHSIHTMSLTMVITVVVHISR